jgi:hypothetical protein
MDISMVKGATLTEVGEYIFDAVAADGEKTAIPMSIGASCGFPSDACPQEKTHWNFVAWRHREMTWPASGWMECFSTKVFSPVTQGRFLRHHS